MPSSPITDPARIARRPTYGRCGYAALSAPGSVRFHIGAWVFARLRVGTGGVNVSLLNRPISSIRRDRRRYQSHGQSRTEKIQSWAKYGIDFTPSNEMWGYAQCEVGMPEPVFTENSEGLVHLKILQGAFTP